MEKKYLVPERQVCFLLNEYRLYEAAELALMQTKSRLFFLLFFLPLLQHPF